MLFGSISYLNLLPFQVFLKRHLKNNTERMSLRYKRAVPTHINKALKKRKVHAGFISSVASRGFKCTNLGIVAHKKVCSVLLLKGENKPDPASATSNELARILGLKGTVLIGDAALQYYLEGGEAIDLAQAWYEKTGLPFVFARLCYNKHAARIHKLARTFEQQHIKIPQYILKNEAKQRGITAKQLTWYLGYISYTMDWKAKQSLKRFLREQKR